MHLPQSISAFRWLGCLSLSLWVFATSNAQNLVPNGDFEYFYSIPNDVGQWDKCKDWFSVHNKRGLLWPYATPDYYHELATKGVRPPSTSFGDVSPYSGEAHMGFVAKNPSGNFREYLSTKMLKPLTPGKEYIVTFYITNGDSNMFGGYGVNSIGICFSVDSLRQQNNEVIKRIPQWRTYTQQWSVGWKKVSFTFKADSAYNFLTIGNFSDDADTRMRLWDPQASAPTAYYFVDDFTVETKELLLFGSQQICMGDKVTLSAFNGVDYRWLNTKDLQTIIGRDSVLQVVPSATTTYMVYDDDDTALHTILVQKYPEDVSLGNDRVICEGDSVFFDFSSATYGFLWHDSSDTQIRSFKQTGTYWLQLQNGKCLFADTFSLQVDTLPLLDLGSDTKLCHGDSLLLAGPIGARQHEWHNGSTTDSLLVTKADTIWCISQNGTCQIADTTIVQMHPHPMLQLPPDTQVCYEDSLVLEPIWQHVDLTWDNQEDSEKRYIAQPGTYWLQGHHPCTILTDTMKVDMEWCYCNLLMANAFSPNGDGINDYFVPVYHCELSYLSITIFNRWGERIYTENGVDAKWDGTFRDVPAPVGVYLYMVQYRFSHSPETHYTKGNVTLVK